MKIITFYIFAILLHSNIAYSFSFNSLKSFDKLNLQIGTWLESYGQVRATKDDDVNGFEFTPYIGIGVEYEIKPKYLIIPEFGYVLQRTSDEVTKNHFIIRADFAYVAKDWLRLRVGSSFMILSYAGDGGEDTLRNGNSTETYYIPEERRNAYNQTLDFGAEFIKERMSFRFQNFVYAWNQTEERTTTYALSFNYLIPYEDL